MSAWHFFVIQLEDCTGWSVRVSPKSTTGVLVRRPWHTWRHRRDTWEKAKWWQKQVGVMQLLQAVRHQRWPPPEVRGATKHSSLETSERAWSYWCLHFGLLAFRTEKEEISVVLSHPVCGTVLLQYPWGTGSRIPPPPTDTKIYQCSNPLHKIAWYSGTLLYPQVLHQQLLKTDCSLLQQPEETNAKCFRKIHTRLSLEKKFPETFTNRQQPLLSISTPRLCCKASVLFLI